MTGGGREIRIIVKEKDENSTLWKHRQRNEKFEFTQKKKNSWDKIFSGKNLTADVNYFGQLGQLFDEATQFVCT